MNRGWSISAVAAPARERRPQRRRRWTISRNTSKGPSTDDYRHRMIVNVAAFVFVIALIGAGLWLADTMARMRKNQDCVLVGPARLHPGGVPPEPLVSRFRPFHRLFALNARRH